MNSRINYYYTSNFYNEFTKISIKQNQIINGHSEKINKIMKNKLEITEVKNLIEQNTCCFENFEKKMENCLELIKLNNKEELIKLNNKEEFTIIGSFINIDKELITKEDFDNGIKLKFHFFKNNNNILWYIINKDNNDLNIEINLETTNNYTIINYKFFIYDEVSGIVKECILNDKITTIYNTNIKIPHRILNNDCFLISDFIIEFTTEGKINLRIKNALNSIKILNNKIFLSLLSSNNTYYTNEKKTTLSEEYNDNNINNALENNTDFSNDPFLQNISISSTATSKNPLFSFF